MTKTKLKTMHWLFPVAVVAAMSLLLIAPIGLGRSELARAVEDAMHAPLFAIVAVALLGWLRRVRPLPSFSREYLRALIAAVALGALGEVAQSMTASRHAEWRDLLYDLLGALAGLCVCALYDKRRKLRTRVRRRLAVVAVFAVASVAAPVAAAAFHRWQMWQHLPELGTWRWDMGHRFVNAISADAGVVALPADESAKQCARALNVSPTEEGRWVGVSLDEPWPDWVGYSALAIDVVNPVDEPLRLIVRIEDEAHNDELNDRYNGAFDLPANRHTTLHIPLLEVQLAPASRRMDMAHISRLVVFQDAEQGAHAFYLCSVRLTR